MSEDSIGTLDPSVHVDEPPGRAAVRRRRLLYRASSTLLTLLVGLAVVEGAGLLPVYGVSTDRVRAEGGGYGLDVRYATVSRPALATPFEIVVRRDGGFDAPVTLAVSQEYLSIWDENGLDPHPMSETTLGGLLLWTFEAPEEGDTLTVSYDARIEPAAQWGKRGTVAVLDDEQKALVSVSFRTSVRP